jgi:hypothetical protein
MSKVNTKSIIGIVLVLAFLGFIATTSPRKSISPLQQSNEAITGEEIKQGSITMYAGGKDLDLAIVPGQNLYQVMTSEANRGKFALSGKEYAGLGFFVEEIGTLQPKQGQFLKFYVNEVESLKGISEYIPQNGDVVRWEISTIN